MGFGDNSYKSSPVPWDMGMQYTAPDLTPPAAAPLSDEEAARLQALAQSWSDQRAAQAGAMQTAIEDQRGPVDLSHGPGPALRNPLTPESGLNAYARSVVPVPAAPQLTLPTNDNATANDNGAMGPGYAPIRSVPAAWVPKSRVVEGRHEIPSAAKFDMGAGLTLQQDAAEKATTAEAQRETQIAGRLNALADAHNDFLADQKHKEAIRAFNAEQAQTRYEQAVERASQQGEINPKRIFADGGAGAQILAIIGVALGEMGSKINGGPNTAAQMINATLDRDLEAQRIELARNQNDVSAAKGVLGEMRQNFGDARQADIAAKDAMLANTELQIKGLIAESKSEEAKARGMDLMGQLQEKRGNLKMQWSAIEEGTTRETSQFVPAHTEGGAPSGGKPKVDDPLFVATGPNGQGYRARGDLEARQGRSLMAAKQNFENLLNKAREVRARTNAGERFVSKIGVYDTEDMEALTSLSDQSLLSVKEAETLGALDKGAEHVGKGVAGDFAKVTGNPIKAGEEYLSMLNRKIENHEKAQGAQGQKQIVARTSDGQVVAGTVGQAALAAPRGPMPSGFKAVGGGSRPVDYQSPQRPVAIDPEIIRAELERRKRARKK